MKGFYKDNVLLDRDSCATEIDRGVADRRPRRGSRGPALRPGQGRRGLSTKGRDGREPLPASGAQALRRGVRRLRAQLRHRQQGRRPDRAGGRRRPRRPRRRDRDRGRRRQHLPGPERLGARHGPRPCRLHGDARDGDQRSGAPGRPGGPGPADARADRHPHVAGGGAYIPLRVCATSTRAGSSSSRRDGNPSSPPTTTPRCGPRDRRRGGPEGDALGVDGVYSADPRLDPTA